MNKIKDVFWMLVSMTLLMWILNLIFSCTANAEELEETSSFEKALEFVLEKEGGYVENEAEPGGAANKGITQATYNEWRERKEKEERSVKYITDQEVKEIYKNFFWTPSRCPEIEEMSIRLAIAHFDWAVNTGPTRAMKTLQSIVDTKVDGIWGPKTQKAVKEAVEENENSLLLDYIKKRREFYRRIVENNPSRKKFLKGWMNRLSDLEERLFSSEEE